MRELALADTGCLAGMVLLSLLLPLQLAFQNRQGPVNNKSCLKTVWLGQGLVVCAAFGALTSATLAHFAAALGLLGNLAATARLFKQCQAVRQT